MDGDLHDGGNLAKLVRISNGIFLGSMLTHSTAGIEARIQSGALPTASGSPCIHHYQRRRTSATGLVLKLRIIIETKGLVGVAMHVLFCLSSFHNDPKRGVKYRKQNGTNQPSWNRIDRDK
jgi:hypothetical protein